MNILVTGGFGFIGSQIVKHHLGLGNKVWVVDNLVSGRKKNLEQELVNPNLQFDIADICTWEKLQQAVSWADSIYHMAAIVGQKLVIENPIRTLRTSVYGCERILEVVSKAPQGKRVFIASSSTVYGHDATSFKEDAVLRVMSGEFIQQSYSLGKLMNEEYALTYAYQKDVDCVIARLFNVVGIFQSSRYGMVIPNFVEQALKGNPLTVYGDGKQTRTFNNVHDALSAIELLMNTEKSRGQIVNIGGTREISILDLAKLIIERTKSSSTIRFIPYKEAYGIDFVDIMRRVPNVEKLERLTGFKSKYTLEQTIDEVIATYKSMQVSI